MKLKMWNVPDDSRIQPLFVHKWFLIE